MKNKAVVVLVILGSLIISIFAGCQQSPLKYIPPTIDSVNNDKSRMGLNGKVKTLDIYYYRSENLRIFAKLRGVTKYNAVREALDLVGLPYNDKKLFSQYSVGMKQRLAISLAVMHEPELLILDVWLKE